MLLVATIIAIFANISDHILQAGFTIRSFEADWGSTEFSEDKHNEELYWKGEVDPDSFTDSPSVIQPEHFQCMFLILGFIMSLGLIVLLWDILTNPSFKFYGLMLAGLSACLLITFANLFFFSTVCWTPTTYDTPETTYFDPFIRNTLTATPARTITTGYYEFDWETLANNKTVASVILGYGAVSSFVFIFLAMIRSLGNSFPH